MLTIQRYVVFDVYLLACQVEHVLPFLRKGIGIHHSGLLPLLKETIEILFGEGLIKVCRSAVHWHPRPRCMAVSYTHLTLPTILRV